MISGLSRTLASFALVAKCACAQSADFDARLALRWAPIHHQDVDRTGAEALGGRADYVTAIDFDGDWVCANNWQAAEHHALDAHAYYSVVESATHWFIVYSFYHPRDWSDTPVVGALDTHENDLEGLLGIVRRPTDPMQDPLGVLEAVVTVFHNDFYSFTPAGSRLRGGRETVDGELSFSQHAGVMHPVTAQEAKGHGLKAWPFVKIEGGDGVVYFPSLSVAQEPRDPNDRNVSYRLVDIFADLGLWARRDDPQTFAAFGTFRGDDGKDDAAHAPWGWDDGDDGPRLRGGELALDPAKLVAIYFDGLPPEGRVYVRNRYLGIEGLPKLAADTAVVLPQVLRWQPPHVRGDRDFAGHGPRVDVHVELRVGADGATLDARIDMEAREWERGELRRDFTTAAGSSPWQIVFRAPAGRAIRAVRGATRSSLTYVDDDHDLDEERRGSEDLVQIFECVGDTRGEEAGSRTRATVYLNPMVVELR